MNRYLLTLILSIAISTNGLTQSKKNDFKLTIAGLPLFGSTDGFDSNLNGFVLKPSIGYFIADRTSIEINFSYGAMSNFKVDNVDSYYTSFAFIPTLRNNFINKTKVRVFGEIGFGLGTIKYNPDNEVQRENLHEALSGGISILGIGIGANYFFSNSFAVELLIPYIKSDNITSQNIGNIYSGIGPTIGLTYVLNNN